VPSDDPEWALRVADDYLRAMGLLLLAWAWLKIAHAAQGHPADAWYGEKMSAARFGMQWLLPEAEWLWHRVRNRDAVLPPAAR
jgi:hypothetical protein